MPSSRVGWQPSRFFADRAEAERAYALAEQLGSINAAATQLAPPGRRCAKQGEEFRPMLSPLGSGASRGSAGPGTFGSPAASLGRQATAAPGRGPSRGPRAPYT